MYDNRDAISISENLVQHDRAKHVEVNRTFIKEQFDNGIITLPFIHSKDQLVDIFTKALNGQIFRNFLRKINWRLYYSTLGGVLEIKRKSTSREYNPM